MSLLRRILKDNAWYQTNVTRPSAFLKRKFASRGVGLLGVADAVYLQLPNKKLFKFLIVADSASKFVYGTYLNEVNPAELKRAFMRLFKNNKCPYFPVLVTDKDKSLGTLAKTFFAHRNMLLRQKRGKAHLMFLEPIIRVHYCNQLIVTSQIIADQ